MGFSNPIVGGQGALIRPAIKSPDYVAGVSGWSINKDGTAEFNNVTVRGTVVVDGDGNSKIQIRNVSGVPVIELFADAPANSVNGAILEFYESGNDQLSLQLFSGTLDSGSDVDAKLYLIAANAVDGSSAVIEATGVFRVESAIGADDGLRVDLTDGSVEVAGTLTANALTITTDATISDDLTVTDDFTVNGDTVLTGTLNVAGKQVAFSEGEISTTPNHAGFTSSSFTAISGAATGTLVKRRGSTRIDMSMSMRVFTNTANTGVEIGLRFTDSSAVSTDVAIALGFLTTTSTRWPVVGFRCTTTLAADTYTVTPIWRRNSTFAAGTLSADSDRLTATFREAVEA